MDDLRERVEAVERALTDGDGDLTALAEGAAAAERIDALEADVADIREDVAELSAATQALRGYVGNVRSVNESVEERADAALAAVESLKERIEAADPNGRSGSDPDPTSAPASADGGRARSGNLGARSSANGGRREDEAEQCRTCGQPTGRRTGSDVSRESHTATAWRSDETGPGGNGQAGVAATREPIDGFDPGDAGPRVTVREKPANPGPGPGEAPAEPDDGAGLVGRMRDLL